MNGANYLIPLRIFGYLLNCKSYFLYELGESQMLKSALGIFISLLVTFNVPVAQAKEQSSPAAKKTAAKKSAPVAKGKAVTASKRSATAAKSTAQSGKAAKRGDTKRAASRKSSKNRDNVSLTSNEKLVKKVVTVRGKRKVIYQREAKQIIPVVPPVMSAGDIAGLSMTRDTMALASNVALVMDQSNSEVLFEKNANVTLPIASITKLMTGLVVVEAQQDMNEILEVTDEDIDREKKQFVAFARRFTTVARQYAAHCVDEFGKPCRFGAGPSLSWRHSRFCHGNECQGKITGHDRHALC
jgi:hypothetical protein